MLQVQFLQVQFQFLCKAGVPAGRSRDRNKYHRRPIWFEKKAIIQNNSTLDRNKVEGREWALDKREIQMIVTRILLKIDKIYMWLCKVYIATQLKLIRNNP